MALHMQQMGARMGKDHHGPGMMMGAHDDGDATPAELADIHNLFLNNERITRTVTNLPNGIKTLTESNDPALAKTIKEHVAGMMQRVGENRDPGLPIESPALKAIFKHYEKIETQVETTENGVLVIQTSDNAEAVAALQTHAGEVSDFAERGMPAMHDAMVRHSEQGRKNEHGNAHQR
jgi:hypothetical protein